MNYGERICRDFLKEDGNKDGKLDIKGVRAAVLMPEYELNFTEAGTLFFLIQKEGYFYYKEYLLSINPALQYHLSKVQDLTPTNIEDSISHSQSLSMAQTVRQETGSRMTLQEIK